MEPRILIAGVGNIFLGDDAFGVEVVRRLQARPPRGNPRIVDFGARNIHLVYTLLEGYDLVILVDATSRGGPPGSLYVIEPDAGEDVPPVAMNAHDLDVDQMLRQLRAMGGAVGRVLLVGCEPASLGESDFGAGLSPAVGDAVDRAVDLVGQLVQDHLTGRPRPCSEALARS